MNFDLKIEIIFNSSLRKMNRKILLFFHSKPNTFLKKNLFFSQFIQRFSINKYHDVVPLNNSSEFPYFTIKNLRIELETNKNLKELRENLTKKNPELLKFQVYEPYTNFEYSELTPVSEIIKNDFVFKLNNNSSFYKVLTNLEQKPFKIFDLQRFSYSNEEKELVNSLLNYGNSNHFFFLDHLKYCF